MAASIVQSIDAIIVPQRRPRKTLLTAQPQQTCKLANHTRSWKPQICGCKSRMAGRSSQAPWPDCQRGWANGDDMRAGEDSNWTCRCSGNFWREANGGAVLLLLRPQWAAYLQLVVRVQTGYCSAVIPILQRPRSVDRCGARLGRVHQTSAWQLEALKRQVAVTTPDYPQRQHRPSHRYDMSPVTCRGHSAFLRCSFQLHLRGCPEQKSRSAVRTR
ncbi:hypothetical protein BBK36DRAFT_1171609 [Trichoderma citrinoviride]|uniref:Uncharacterized protein n=1 Tax=Trichoderma citrinoviride TaxID=58853 RepID=A0A2T4B2A2_9HYPO|nr:hypothetical protein BBK36DRAFT_1171609 [Trichoderma citrinoviride]PTB63368.1 hypothetical protein BBK36DRAFT_1171609 [Trichoderma citrinoviride]